MHQKQHLLVCIILSFILTLLMLVHLYTFALWGNNYNAPLSQIVKSQNKTVSVINDVPLMESITAHYTFLSLRKFPDIVKLNTCLLFQYDYIHHVKFPNIPVSLVPELHNYSTRSTSSNQVAIPHFELIFGDLASALLEVSFGMIFHNSSGTNHREKCSEKHFYAGTLFSSNDTLSPL